MYKDPYVFTCRWLESESGKLQNWSNVSSSLLTSQVGTRNLLGQNPKIPNWPQLHGLVELHSTEGLPAEAESWSIWPPLGPFYLLSGRDSTLGPQSLVGSKDDSNKDQACKGWFQAFHPEVRARHPHLCHYSEGSHSPSLAVLTSDGQDISFPTVNGRVLPAQPVHL